jgi:hypothetical protein
VLSVSTKTLMGMSATLNVVSFKVEKNSQYCLWILLFFFYPFPHSKVYCRQLKLPVRSAVMILYNKSFLFDAHC